jgi:hypothetical protein
MMSSLMAVGSLIGAFQTQHQILLCVHFFFL